MRKGRLMCPLSILKTWSSNTSRGREALGDMPGVSTRHRLHGGKKNGQEESDERKHRKSKGGRSREQGKTSRKK